MKICGKKLLSLALAAAMSGCMVSAYANTVEITDVKVLSGPEDTMGKAFKKDGSDKFTGSLSPEQLLQVTVKLSGDSGAAIESGDVSFLSYDSVVDTEGSGKVLDNSTIQYVDQKESDEVANETYRTATITFRPRLDAGSFVAKAGGTDVSEADSFSYTVAEALKTMTMTGKKVSFEVGGTATFELKDENSAAFADSTAMTVKNNATELSTTLSDTNVYYGYSNGILSVYNLPVGSHNISVSIEGYNDASDTVNVTAKTPVGPTEQDKENAEKGLKDAVNSISSKGSEVILPTTVKTTENPDGYTIGYTIADAGSSNAQISGGKLTLKDNAFGAKVQLTADLGNGVTETKTIYLFKEGTTEDDISFGNVEMIADAAGSDAFANDDEFSTVIENNPAALTTATAEILNLALGRGDIANVPKGAVDINLDGNVTLAEYRMFKLLISTDEADAYYKPSNFAAARQRAVSTSSETGE